MGRFTKAVIIAACAVICASQPVEKLPVLQEAPVEILFKVSDQPEALTLPCSTTENVEGVSYKWEKNGKLFTPEKPDVVRQDGVGTLVFSNPKPDDEGDYQCFADVDKSTASSRVIKVRYTYLEAPKVTSQKHNPVEKRPYKLDCDIPKSYPKPEITWERQYESDPSISSAAADARYTISPEGDLYIASAEKDDLSENFKYVCLAKNAAVDKPVPLAEHIIESLEKDSKEPDSDVVHQYASEDMVALYGEQLYLYCIYGGTPMAHPDWYKDGKNVNNSPKDRVTRYNKSKGKRLLIREVWMEDEGTYTCIVDNEVGKPLNHSMRLSVVRAPEFVGKPQPVVHGKAGQDLTIYCRFASHPQPKVTWTYNAEPLPQNDRYVVASGLIGNNYTMADLTIKKLQASDKGYFGCHAENEYGDVYAESLVHL